MFFPLYLAALGISAGIVGAFGRRLIAMGGYITDFEAGIAAVIMVAGGYVLIESAYGALIQFLKPYKGKGPHITECLSLLSAVVLVPFLMNVSVPWPHPKLAEVEPAIYLLAFGALHVFFKLATLFAATQSPPATPVRVVPYLVVAGLAFLGMQYGFNQWYTSLKGVRTAAPAEAKPVRIGDTYADGRRVTEGLVYQFHTLPGSGEHLTLRWASPVDAAAPIETIHVTCSFFRPGEEEPIGSVKETLALSESDWFEMRVGAESIPDGTETCGIYWNLDEEPEWVRQTGLRPAFTSGREMLLSGPFVHHDPRSFERPNVVVILVEGLGADHMNLLGYERLTTPKLTLLGGRSMVWENAFTACPDTYSTTMTLFTGLSPLSHGSKDGRMTPPPATGYLPVLMRDAGYATVAFTEGEGTDGQDLVYGSGIEAGFQLFNAHFPQEPLTQDSAGPAPLAPKGSRITLQRAAEWIREHREQERYLMFIRLRELRNPFVLKRYGKGYIKPWERIPQPLDVYDTVVEDVDKQLGLFLDRLREMGSLDDTCVVITSPYGLDFSEPGRGAWRRGGPGVPRLTEESCHVPLIISLPEGIGRTRQGLVSLNALGVTLADLSRVVLDTGTADRSLLDYTPAEEPVTIMGDPVQLSLRTLEWRYTWQSGLRAINFARAVPAESLELIHIDDYKEKKWSRDYRQSEPQLTRALSTQLEAYIAPFAAGTGGAQ